MKKYIMLLMAAFMLLLSLSMTAMAADNTVVEIDNADELMKVLATTPSDAYSETYGKRFVLQDDITIDTSDLLTSYTTEYAPSRKFQGVLDGNGHTITVVSASGAEARPLFDSIEGSQGGYYAGVQNLNVVFKDNVAGTTIASLTSYVRMSNVNISFEKDIVFAQNSSGYAIATGVYGFTSGGIDVRLDNVSVTATGEAQYGIIGSKTAQNARYVLASGVYTECNVAGGGIVCDGVSVNVRGIYAVSEFVDDYYSISCAAGVATGYSQTNLHLRNSDVKVAEDIFASTTEESTSAASAYGLGYYILALYNCHVTVGGNIEATAHRFKNYDMGDSHGGDKTVSAAGFGFLIQPKYNYKTFGVTDTGVCSITVGGSILAEIKAPQDDETSAKACGAAVWSSHDYVWSNIAIKVDGDIKALATGTADAYANGFIHQPVGNTVISDCGCENCSVTVSNIVAESTAYGGYATGFMRWCYTTCKDCTVSVGTISGSGIDADASGFAYRFFPYTALEKECVLDNCSVIVDKIISVNTDPYYSAVTSGFAFETENMSGYDVSGTIVNCEVVINEELISNSADGISTKALWIYQDATDKYELHKNTVTLPKSQAEIITIDGADYVRFTASELDGQADDDTWESGNQVIFTGDSINSVSCAFDDSNTTYGTLWELKTITTLHSVQYDLNGGYASEGVDYSDIVVSKGEEITLLAAPQHDTHNFTGWHDGENLLTPGETVEIHKDTVFTAQWEKPEEEPPTPPPYIPPDIPPAQPDEPEYTPDGLNTKDHFSYIIGYDDGTIKPDAYITRAEVATVFFRLLTDEAMEEFWSESNDYTDVASADWFNNAVSTLSNMGILGGYEDCTFRPNATITRAEFAKIAVSFFDREGIEADNVFVDVAEGSWYEDYVAVAAEIGLIEGYAGDIFRPDASITRAEACTIINRTLGRAPDKDHLLPVNEMNTWVDNADSDVWYYAQIQEATNSHDYRWSGDTERWTAKLGEPDWDKLQY